MSDEFTTPGTATGIQWKDLHGRLLLFTVHAVEPSIKTAFGEGPAIRVDMTVLDGPDPGDDYPQALVFPKVLQGQLRGAVGKKVLGRLGYGQAKTGQSPPWRLEDPTDADKTVARKWISDHDEPPF